MTSAALAARSRSAGCKTDGISLRPTPRRNAAGPAEACSPRSPTRTWTMQSPILVRLFKEEAELEVWKQDRTGRFALLKTYPICRWSGDLGPKVREGDRQAPEGFYTITPGADESELAVLSLLQLGYPNAFDRAHDRTGAHLMVHGDCSSRGCYAMTDEQIAEIYRARPRVLLRRPEIVPGAGLSVPDDAGRTWPSTATIRTCRSGR